MLVKDLLKCEFKLVCGENSLDREIDDVYIGDLLSWVMGRAKDGCAWITIQGHLNIVAVAVLVDVACIIVAEDSAVSPDTIAKATEENIPVFTTSLSSYEVAKLLVNQGL